MIDFLYRALEDVGYSHPLHPPFAHAPIGIILGLLVVAFIALLSRRRMLAQSAHYPFIIIAFIASFPLVFLGLTDWQHFYEGVWLFPIKIKLVLTGVLLVLLAAGILFSRKGTGATKTLLIIYVLCFLTVSGLGYFGAELVFGTSASRTVPKVFAAGSKIFEAQCQSCHQNVTALSGSSHTASFAVFLAFLRKPSGGMPTFLQGALSNDRAMQLYHFIVRYPCLPEKPTGGGG